MTPTASPTPTPIVPSPIPAATPTVARDLTGTAAGTGPPSP